MLTTAGVDARANGTLLTTARGEYQITPECLLTPVLPMYLAAILSLPLGRRRGLVALAATVPIFFALGVIRVLVLALPAALIGSPLFVVHGFFQIVTALVIVAVACRRSPNERPTGAVAWDRYAGAVCIGVIAVVFGVSPITRLIVGLAGAIRPWFPNVLTQLAIPGDLQGVLALAPAYQIGLLAALWFAWRPRARFGRVTLALAALVLVFVACLAATGAWLAHFGTVPHALVLRAWSLLVPLGVAWLFLRVPADQHADAGTYRRFWHEVGDEFPDLGGAASTRLYAENEQDLLLQHLPARAGARLLKTDLWDEAKNTRILHWAAAQGADVYGLDVSMPTVKQAKREFAGDRSPFVVADVRQVPFASGSFDAIYSMGTIEHFDETEAAVVELARLLKPGGRLILGVPNRHDPFLRPLMVFASSRSRVVRLRVRKVLLAQTAPANARGGRTDGDRRDGHPVHSRVAPHARPAAVHAVASLVLRHASRSGSGSDGSADVFPASGGTVICSPPWASGSMRRVARGAAQSRLLALDNDQREGSWKHRWPATAAGSRSKLRRDDQHAMGHRDRDPCSGILARSSASGSPGRYPGCPDE